MPRSPLFHGLGLTLRYPRPLLWAYAFSFVLAWATSIGLRAQYANLTATSLASQRLIGGFDLGVVLDALRRMSDAPAGSITTSFMTMPLYLILFFLLVPGTLLSYQSRAGLTLGGLLQTGLASFWSFVRITLLTLLVAGPVLAGLGAISTAYSARIDRSMTGRAAFVLSLLGTVIVFLVAALLRLYFDLVEVHTVARARLPLTGGKPDRRVRKTLGPAFKMLQRHFAASYLSFIFLSLLGAAASVLLTLSALHHLAQPRVWPTALLAQASVFVLIFARFWQRATQTVRFENDRTEHEARRSNVFVAPTVPEQTSYATAPEHAPEPPHTHPPDAIPEPEPIAPSLDEPDPGVYHRHEPI